MDSRTRVLLLGTGFAGFVLLGLAQAIFGPVLPVYSTTFGLGLSTVGWLLSVFWAGSLAAVAAVYVLPTTLGPKIGLACSASGTLLLALMPSWAVVLTGAALFGFGYGVIAAVYNPRVLAAFGPRGPAMMSVMNALFTVGAIAAPQVFLGLNQNPAAVFWLFTGFAGLILIAAVAMGDTRTASAPDSGAQRIDWPVLGFAFFGIGMESSLVGLGPTALGLAGKTSDQAAGLLSAFFITYLVARISLIFLASRVPAFPIYSIAMALLAVLGAAALFGDVGFWFPFMGFACGYFFYGAFLTGLRRMGANTRTSAILLAAGMVGAIVQPLVISQVLGSMGPMGFFQIILALSIVLAVIAALMTRRLSRG